MAYKKKGGWGGDRRTLLTPDEREDVWHEYVKRSDIARIVIAPRHSKRRASKAWRLRIRKEVAQLCTRKFGKKVTERMVDRIRYGS